MRRLLLLCGCIFAVSAPLFALELSGYTQYCHDPSTIIYADGKYWCFSTNNNLNLRSSTDLMSWTWEPSPFSYPAGVPQYMADYLQTCEGGTSWNLWAPDIIQNGSLYYLFYSRNMCHDYDGTERSVCGLAVGSGISARDWVDQEPVLWSALNVAYRRNIDPALMFDPSGNLWMAAGSFGHPSVNGWNYGGIWLYQLDNESGMIKPGTNPAQLARAWIEAPYLYYRNGCYYLFFNQQSCCMGTASKYYIRYGRATAITGPYYDKEGVNLLVQNTGGSLFHGRDYFANYIDTDGGIPRPELGSVGREIGPGHISIMTAQDGLEMYAYHYYDADNDGMAALAVRTLVWGDDGWPRAGWNLANGSYAVVPCTNADAGAPAGGLYVEADEQDAPRLWAWHGLPNQIWNFTRVDRNQYRITSLADNKALAVISPDENPNNIYGPFKPVGLVTYSSSNNAHRWYVVQTNNRAFRIVNVLTSMALEVFPDGSGPGTRLRVNEWNPAQVSRQRFWLTPTGIYNMQAQFGQLYAGAADPSVGTRLATAPADQSDQLKWRFIPTPDGYNRIVNLASGLSVELRNNSFADNEEIRQNPDSGADAQKWSVETLTDGSSRILNKSTGKTFTVTGSASGAYINQLRWLHTLAQQWTLHQQAVSPGVRTWTGGAGSDKWSDAHNWDSPGFSGELLLFNAASMSTLVNDLPADHRVGGIRFSEVAGGLTLTGCRLELAGDIANKSVAAQYLNLPLKLLDGRETFFTADSGKLTAADISGAGHLVKNGAGTLTLSGAGSWAGTTKLLEGTLKIASQNALPVDTALVIAADAVLDLNGFDVTVASLENNGTIVDSSCQGAILFVTDSQSAVILHGSGTKALISLADYWLQTCAPPDWCLGSDRNQSGKTDLYDLNDLAQVWLDCE